MDGLTFQTHTVYRDLQSGALLLLVHHNPMALCSLLLARTADGKFDPAQFQPVGVDTIIAMRKSGQFEEMDPLPVKEIRRLLDELAKHVSAEDEPLILALIDQLEKK